MAKSSNHTDMTVCEREWDHSKRIFKRIDKKLNKRWPFSDMEYVSAPL
jgi:hypothetical protein